MVGSREGSGHSIFSRVWQCAWALLALRWLMRSRSRWSYVGCLRQPSACPGQRSCFAQVFSQLHSDIMKTLVWPFLASWGFLLVCALWGSTTILWGSASCGDFGLVSGTLHKQSPLPGTVPTTHQCHFLSQPLSVPWTRSGDQFSLSNGDFPYSAYTLPF